MARPLQDATLNMPCQPCLDAKQALEAIDELERSLASLPPGLGLGLAANQIGLDCQVAIIRSRELGVAIDLINPRITKAENPIKNVAESCLSFPGRAFSVPRFGQIWVEMSLVRSGQFERGSGQIVCWPVVKESMPADAHLHRCEFGFGVNQLSRHYGGIVCLAVQHEIDHLNGITVVSKEGAVEVAPSSEIRAAALPKVGRNEPCPCGSGRKYKKCCGG